MTVRGLKHRLTWWGEPSDSPIVLLHGFQDCGDTWQFLVDCLPDTWTLVAPDWRGFGGTEWAPGGYWFPDYLADLEALLALVAPRGPARVVGHSMGGNVAALYSGIRPKRLKWFVNLEGIGGRRIPADNAPANYANWLDQVSRPMHEGSFESVQHLAELLVERNPLLPLDRALFVARAWTRDTDRGLMVKFDPRHRFVNPILYRREEAEACWSRCEVPVLFIAGENSTHQQRRLANYSDEFVRQMFRDAQVVVLPGLGHMMHHEDPQAVAAPIIEFAGAHP